MTGNHFLFGLVFLVLSKGISGDDCEVSVSDGRILGSTMDTLVPDRKACAYLRIPFAAPPLGELRFKSPQAPQPFGILNATTLPNWCPQAGSLPNSSISEDCLYLNVFHPQTSDVANLPVMVWIYGGSFTSGSSDYYTPSRLLARGDVILVVPHYRLGILGFLSTGDEVAPGNWGLKDQSFALNWVKENIANFGGNPNQVTIFGESAGSISSLFHMLSPLSMGLIHGVIAQSGTALSSNAYDKNPWKSAQLIGEHLSCPVNSSSELVECLRQLDWNDLIKAQLELTNESYQKMEFPTAGVRPVIEPPHATAFISETPLKILHDGDIAQIPVMLGATKHDGSLLLANLWMSKWGPEKLDLDPVYMRNQIVPDIIKYFGDREDEANRAVSSSLELAYLAGVNRSSWNESVPGLVDIMTVFNFKSSALHTADLLSARNLPVFLFSFEHHSNNTFVWDSMPVKPPLQPGIAHADDLMYLFDFFKPLSLHDLVFSEIFVDLWINFATFGNPTSGQDARFNTWPVYDSSEQFFMKLNVTPTVLQDYMSSWRPNGFEWN